MTKRVGGTKVFQEHLKNCRENLGLSRRKAAKQLGCHPSYLANIENAEEIPSYNLLVRLAEMYGEDPLTYLAWRAQEKNEYDLHRCLKSVQARLQRVVPLHTVSMAAEAQAEYPDNSDDGEQGP